MTGTWLSEIETNQKGHTPSGRRNDVFPELQVTKPGERAPPGQEPQQKSELGDVVEAILDEKLETKTFS